MTLVTFSLGLTTAVFVAGSASAAPSATKTTKTTTAKKTTTTKPTTKKKTTPKSPEERYLVLNGTANAGSVHVIGGSSAFPNFKTGAIDNYYSLAHSHVDNAPFAQGTASPLDTGPIGQTAAAGHFQQPQYADARWPGDSGKATYGKQGEPYAAATASEYRATAEASAASQGLSGPSGPSGPSAMVVPRELDDRLRQALGAWNAIWEDRLAPKKPAAPITTPKAPVTIPKPPVTIPKAPVTTPSATVTTPIATVPTPGGSNSTPPAPVPPPALPPPTLPSGSSSAPPRSLSSASASRDGMSLLESSALATLDPKTGALVTSGESTLGRVSLGGGQIVIEDIHVSASITNDGEAPTHKVAVSVGKASIGGVPVTIDQDGVHIAAQRQGLPYRQASDALNGALKQAGIQLFLVAPEITTNACDETGTGTDTGTGTGSGTGTTTTSNDQSGTSTMPDSCDQSGATTTPLCEPTSTDTTTTGTTTTTTTTSPTPTTPSLPTSSSFSSDQTDTTSTTSSCGEGFQPTASGDSCVQPGTSTHSSTGTATTTSTSEQERTTTTPSSSDQTFTDPGMTSSGGMTISATGLRVVFTQPAGQSGVPAQHAEYNLGEVFLDSLAVPAGPLPDLDLLSSSSPLSSSCVGGSDPSGATSGAASTGGGSLSAGGSTSSSTLSPSASEFGATSQPVSSSTGNSLPVAFAAALKKPLWLLLAYVLWQAIVIGTGVSLWNWRRGEAA